ncbi:type VI secretion system baseplate subunit TssG [Paraburkholderia phenoliruptrix]|uniref:type VI secretion system baseplate subunit TssG n=1 Tax=Paraburkholderia phenoliruptrix TaxID=252970 RepID=UPI0001FAF3FD|nr:type VI secretion system protein ImpH [Paraburkholderia phenoliruptrix]WMY11903.1 type VI secretion system baseplate subunit TssG [Paraburkholderia phenoliruptrix]
MTSPPLEPHLSPTLLENLHSTPWRHGFLALLRRLNANLAMGPIGTALLPDAENFRLGQKPSLIFAAAEIADARVVDGKLRIRLFGLGMLGPNGPLPIHVTEIAREREELRRDSTLSNFLDIFHHRSLSLLYRAWAAAQSAASLDRPDDDRFSFHVSALAGVPQRRLRGESVPTHARLAASPHLVRHSRNPDGLRSTLTRYFGVPVEVSEFELDWMPVEPVNRCRMGEESTAATLGGGALLGEHVPDRRHRFRVVLGPLDLGQYLRFTPQGKELLPLVEWVRIFTRGEYRWLLELQIKPDCAVPMVLGDNQQLGWSGWLGESPGGKPVVGMRFEPEMYVLQLRRDAAGRAHQAACELTASRSGLRNTILERFLRSHSYTPRILQACRLC